MVAGRTIARVRGCRGDTALELVNLDGSNRRSLLDSEGSGVWDPKWSPDGQRVFFCISDGYYDWCFGLWTVNADDSDARQLGGRGVVAPRPVAFPALGPPSVTPPSRLGRLTAPRLPSGASQG